VLRPTRKNGKPLRGVPASKYGVKQTLGEPTVLILFKISCLKANARYVAAPPTMELGLDIIALLTRLQGLDPAILAGLLGNPTRAPGRIPGSNLVPLVVAMLPPS
jgi:hypothetical protein